MRVFFLVFALASSVVAGSPKVADWEAVGKYFALGYESHRSLELREDNTFLMVLCARGSDLSQIKIEERGTWKIEGDVITLTPEDGKPYGPDIWYARLLLRKRDAKRELRVGVTGAWGYDKIGLEEGDGEQVTTGNAGEASLPAAESEPRRP
jgi:hypothetical protein